ncbi:hypothetical protein PoB_006209900 [Plakobranchus ocellatus]|uniref:Uncharacterized protein n=1 Tax=Plakobranchus ocellatus TaxID=259542 RepID=A0AAV4CUP6_9GAST|nr:hypothetical protein PoB_006209900 [Plakobranchus ocellatus]
MTIQVDIIILMSYCPPPNRLRTSIRGRQEGRTMTRRRPPHSPVAPPPSSRALRPRCPWTAGAWREAWQGAWLESHRGRPNTTVPAATGRGEHLLPDSENILAKNRQFWPGDFVNLKQYPLKTF